MDKPLSKILIFVLLAGSVAGAALAARSHRSQPTDIPPLLAAPVATPTPSQITTVSSPDGQISANLKQEKSSGQITYTVFISGQDGSQNTIFSKTYDSGTILSVPANTFSPDNRHLFLKEAGPNGTSYIVLSADGSAITKDNQTLEIAGLFSQEEPNYKITDVTGWAAPTLIIVNSDKKEGGVGPSFWFEIPTQSFIRLSNRFN